MYIINNERTLTYIDYQPVYKGLNITEFGEETNNDTRNSSFCYRHNYIIHFVLNGTGYFYRDDKTYPLSKGKAFLITPKNLVRYEATKGTNWTYCWISFSGTDCDTLFDRCGFSSGLAVFDYSEDDIQPLKLLLSTIREGAPSNQLAFSFFVQAKTFEILKNFTSKLRIEEPKQQGISSSIISTAISYMQANLHKPINISIICQELNISRAYFSTLFEKTMKQSPYQYLQNLRIQRASELLLSDKSLHIYELTEMVGFSSSAQFCKAFHKTIGCRPSQFRKQYAKNEKLLYKEEEKL